MTLILFEQTITMLLLMGIGMALTRAGWMDDAFTKKLGAILLNVVTPCTVLNGFLDPPEGATVADLGVALAASVIMICVSVAIGLACYGPKRGIDAFATTFSNCGFIGIPLVSAVYGSGAMLYLAAFIAVFNIAMFTYGEWLLTKDATMVSPRSVATNPVVIACLLGIAIFVLGIRLPVIIADAVADLADANTAVAMLILGSYLAKLDLRSLVDDRTVWATVGMRNVVCPLAIIAALRLFGMPANAIVLSTFIAAAAPSAGNTALFAQQFDLDYERAVKIVCLSTVISVITLPIMFGLAMRVMA